MKGSMLKNFKHTIMISDKCCKCKGNIWQILLRQKAFQFNYKRILMICFAQNRRYRIIKIEITVPMKKAKFN